MSPVATAKAGGSVLIVGSVALDSVRTPFGEAHEALGGAATYASVAAGLFASPIRVVGVVGRDFPDEHLAFLRERGVDLAGLVRADGRTFRWTGHYGENLNEAKTLDTQLNVFADFDPVLPESYRDSEFVLLANIDPVLQTKVLDQVRSPKLVVADTMNFWIQNKREALIATWRRVDIVILNDGEARMLSGRTNLVSAARDILALGPKYVVIKKGEHGAILFGQGLTAVAPAYLVEHVKDPTGAGDSFAGGFLGHLASRGSVEPDDLRTALAVGTVVASFNIEDFSLGRLRNLTVEEVERRTGELRRLADLGEAR